MKNWWNDQPAFDKWALGYGMIGTVFALAGLGFDSDPHITVGLMMLFAVGMVAGYRLVLKEESGNENGAVPEPQAGE